MFKKRVVFGVEARRRERERRILQEKLGKVSVVALIIAAGGLAAVAFETLG